MYIIKCGLIRESIYSNIIIIDGTENWVCRRRTVALGPFIRSIYSFMVFILFVYASSMSRGIYMN